jgi:hypothetical protein
LLATVATDWLTAIGTLAAVIVALGLSLVPVFVRWLHLPKLRIIVGSSEPHLRPRMAERGPHVEAMYLRVEVRNYGKAEARRVRAQVRRWWARNNNSNPPRWVEYDIDPLPLRWVSRPMDAGEALSTEVDLAPEASDLVEVSVYLSPGGKTLLCAPSHAQRRFRLESNYPIGEHRVEVLVVSESAGSQRTVVSYTTSHGSWISNVHRSEPPQEHDVLQVGLVALLGGTRDAESGT